MNSVNAGVLNFRGEWLSRIYDHYFDKVLVDAPCSGLGILQKKSEIGNWWNEDKLNGLSELQYKLLVSALKMVKIGGEIVYSTCTWTVERTKRLLIKILRISRWNNPPKPLPLSANREFLAIKENFAALSSELSLRSILGNSSPRSLYSQV
jgi:16S rRNA (cytosine1407-C5)-methyltransferase